MTLENCTSDRIESIVAAQKKYFASGATRSREFRLAQLKKLQYALEKWEQPLYEALWKDLHKSMEEAFMTETSIVFGEIKTAVSHLKRWMKDTRVSTPMKMFPSRSRILKEPLGNTLIMSPWNYPVQLLLNPLVGAIAAGCTSVLKPSPYVPEVSLTLEKMIRESFEERYIAVIQGNREVNTALLSQRFDLIFFTGSPKLGRTVMAAAAKHLTPCILELGGKSPCIIDRDADIDIAAKRVAWGKTLNSGQTCIAPDYLMIHRNIQEQFIEAFAHAVHELHGENVQQSPHYVRMVNDKAFERVSSYLKDGKIVFGGRTDASERFIEPTLLTEVSPEAPIMQNEIFGPVFPIIPFEKTEEVIDFINDREKPLALYYFGSESTGRDILHHTSSGGACLNDTIMHIANERMPFGGVGNSGMGRYHGKRTFDAFTHERSVIFTPTWIDLPFRYMPYRMFSLVKRLLK